MPAGRYRHVVTLERRVQAPDDSVGIDETFTPVDEVWAEVRAVQGSVYAAGMQIGERITHRFTMRYRRMDDFNHIARDGRRYLVRDVRDPDGRLREIQVMAEELAPEVPV